MLGGFRRLSGWISFSSTKSACNLLAGSQTLQSNRTHPPQPMWFPDGGKHSCWGCVAPMWPHFHQLSLAQLSSAGMARPGGASARLRLAWSGRARLLLAQLGPAQLGSAWPTGRPQSRRNISPFTCPTSANSIRPYMDIDISI